MYLACQGELIKTLMVDYDFEHWSTVPAQDDGEHVGFTKLLNESAGKLCKALCGLEEPTWEPWLAGGAKGSSTDTMYNEPSRKAMAADFSAKGGSGKTKPTRRELTGAGVEMTFHTKSEYQRMRARVAAATLHSMRIMAMDQLDLVVNAEGPERLSVIPGPTAESDAAQAAAGPASVSGGNPREREHGRCSAGSTH